MYFIPPFPNTHTFCRDILHLKCSATSWWSELLPEVSPAHLLSRDFAQVPSQINIFCVRLAQDHSQFPGPMIAVGTVMQIAVAGSKLQRISRTALTCALKATEWRTLNSSYYFTSNKYKSPQQHTDNLNIHFLPSQYRSKIEFIPSGKHPKEILSCQPKQCCI